MSVFTICSKLLGGKVKYVTSVGNYSVLLESPTEIHSLIMIDYVSQYSMNPLESP